MEKENFRVHNHGANLIHTAPMNRTEFKPDNFCDINV